jgi:hypothetical protein
VPQFCGSVASFTQAVGATVGHGSGSDAGHLQMLPEQISSVSRQAFPHDPQLSESFVVFTQAVGVPTGHGVGSEAGQAQTPPEQASCVSGHACPQPPSPAQFLGSVCVFVQNVVQSSGFAPPQAHAPDWQMEPSFVAVQELVHEPHAASSVCRSLQRGTRFVQSVSLEAQTQAPPEHVAPVPQAMPHAPQLLGSVW